MDNTTTFINSAPGREALHTHNIHTTLLYNNNGWTIDHKQSNFNVHIKNNDLITSSTKTDENPQEHKISLNDPTHTERLITHLKNINK